MDVRYKHVAKEQKQGEVRAALLQRSEKSETHGALERVNAMHKKKRKPNTVETSKLHHLVRRD
jgi:hypothetical protein